MARIDTKSMIHEALEADPNETSSYRLKVRDTGGGGGQSAFSASAEDYVGKASGSGDVDFTTAYTSGTTITLSGTPYTVTAADIISIVQIPTSGTSTVFSDPVKFSVTSGVVTVTGATFAATDTFIVVLSGRKAFSLSTNSTRNEEINPLSQQFIEEEWVDTTNVTSAATGTYYPSSTGKGLAGTRSLAIEHALSNTDYVSTLTYEASLDDAASPDFIDITKAGLELNSYTRSNASFAVTSAAASNIVLFDVAPFKLFRAKIVHSGSTNAMQLHCKTVVL